MEIGSSVLEMTGAGPVCLPTDNSRAKARAAAFGFLSVCDQPHRPQKRGPALPKTALRRPEQPASGSSLEGRSALGVPKWHPGQLPWLPLFLLLHTTHWKLSVSQRHGKRTGGICSLTHTPRRVRPRLRPQPPLATLIVRLLSGERHASLCVRIGLCAQEL